MRLLLKDFQVDGVDQLVTHMRDASAVAGTRNQLQAISLASPTGSGKTVIATAAIERILEGDADAPAMADAIFLWISDQPEINEQTYRKMLASSSVLGPSQLQIVETTFDQRTLSPGVVHFLNTQKLGRDRNLVKGGDERDYTIWETISNTEQSYRDRFFVVIDEAHRGMAESQADRELANSIVQKFIKGSSGEIPAVPLVVGVSATPTRFQNLIAGTARVQRPVLVPVELVRTSGLLKEVITLHHPTETQPSDITLLRAAARAWKDYATRWQHYCDEQQEDLVKPLLVVQVEDASGQQMSRTNIGDAIQAIQDEVGSLPESAIAHSFQEGSAFLAGGRTVRYLAPADIADDDRVTVAFFKTSLNTGWDCPRAEVMMSFRPARDATLIAQLIGRMVRTPLARRVDADELLNTVALYLPHYDRAGLRGVIQNLTSPDHDFVPPVSVEMEEDSVSCTRNGALAACFAATEAIPSYVIPSSVKTSQVRRLMKFARLLAKDGLEDDAVNLAKTKLVSMLGVELGRFSETDAFKSRLTESGSLDVRSVALQYATGESAESTSAITVSSENIQDLFNAAGRKLGEGIHKDYWKARVLADKIDRDQAKLEVAALAADPEAGDSVERAAREQVKAWTREHEGAIANLPEGERQAYREIQQQGSDPELTMLKLPEWIETKASEDRWQNHLYVDETGTFPCKLNSWERRVIAEELGKADVVGWLRNPDRKTWSLRVPYEIDGDTKPVYPDFLVFRQEAGSIKVDLLDPHLESLEDAPPKAKGLASFAREHGHAFGRIELIIVEDERVKRLDLKDEDIRQEVLKVNTTNHLRALFQRA